MSEDKMMWFKKATVTNPDGRSYSVESEPKGHQANKQKQQD